MTSRSVAGDGHTVDTNTLGKVIELYTGLMGKKVPESSSSSQGVPTGMDSVSDAHGDSLFVPSFRALDCSNFISIGNSLYRQLNCNLHHSAYIIFLKIKLLVYMVQ